MATRITLISEPGVYLAPVCYYWDSFARRDSPAVVLRKPSYIRLYSKKLSNFKVVIIGYDDLEIDNARVLGDLRNFVLEHGKEKIIVLPPPVVKKAGLEDSVVDFATSMDIDLWYSLIDALFPSEDSRYAVLNKNLKTIVTRSQGSLSLVRWLAYEQTWVDIDALLTALKGSDWYSQHTEHTESVAKWLDAMQVFAVALSLGAHDLAFQCTRSRFLPAEIRDEALTSCKIIVTGLLADIELKEIVSVEDRIPSYVDRGLVEAVARAVPEGVVDIRENVFRLNGFI